MRSTLKPPPFSVFLLFPAAKKVDKDAAAGLKFHFTMAGFPGFSPQEC